MVSRTNNHQLLIWYRFGAFFPWDSDLIDSELFVRQDVYGTVPASMAMMLANCISLAWVGASQMACSLEMLQHGEYGDKEDH